MTEPDGRRWTLGQQGLQLGHRRWAPDVRSTLYHGRPRELVVTVARGWRASTGRARRRPQRVPTEPGSLATSLDRAEQAVAWSWQRGWIEPAFNDSPSRFGLTPVQVGGPARLSRLLAALTLARAWRTLAARPELGPLPPDGAARVAPWGRLSLIRLARDLRDRRRDLPLAGFPPAVRAACRS